MLTKGRDVNNVWTINELRAERLEADTYIEMLKKLIVYWRLDWKWNITFSQFEAKLNGKLGWEVCIRLRKTNDGNKWDWKLRDPSVTNPIAGEVACETPVMAAKRAALWLAWEMRTLLNLRTPLDTDRETSSFTSGGSHVYLALLTDEEYDIIEGRQEEENLNG